MIKFNALTEGRQSTINHIIKTKASIRILENEIKGMVDETKSYLIDNKIDRVTNDLGADVVYIKEGKSAPSFKQVYEKVKDQLSAADQAILETAFENSYKASCSIMFNY